MNWGDTRKEGYHAEAAVTCEEVRTAKTGKTVTRFNIKNQTGISVNSYIFSADIICLRHIDRGNGLV